MRQLDESRSNYVRVSRMKDELVRVVEESEKEGEYGDSEDGNNDLGCFNIRKFRGGGNG